jgi:hypothetical protein
VFELRMGWCSLPPISERFSDDVELHSDGSVMEVMKPLTFIVIVVRFQLRSHCLDLEDISSPRISMTNIKL